MKTVAQYDQEIKEYEIRIAFWAKAQRRVFIIALLLAGITSNIALYNLMFG